MADKQVQFEGKIKVRDNANAKMLLGLLKYLIDDLEFSIKKLEPDEIELVNNEFIREQQGDIEITKSNVQVEIEIEVSENEMEIEVESESMELVQKLISQIAARF